jgi:hypothetical protein
VYSGRVLSDIVAAMVTNHEARSLSVARARDRPAVASDKGFRWSSS